MKVITEERLKELFENHYMENTLTETLEKSIMDECQEIDTLTPKETDLVLAAEKYAELYDGDDR